MTDRPTAAEWKAHQAFYKLTVAQRDSAWREIDQLKAIIAAAEEPATRHVDGALGVCDCPDCTEEPATP